MPNTVIVSAFFKIPSKQPYAAYLPHLNRFFRSLRCPTIFFTSQDVFHDIQSFGHDLSFVQFVMMEVDDFKAWNRGREFWNRQKERDPESYHTPELAAIWYEKKEFVLRAMKLSDADEFIWCDAGCVRNDESERAFIYFGCRGIPLNDNTLHIQHIRIQSYRPFYVYPEYRFAAAIIAGNRTAWNQYSTLYDSVLTDYDTRGISGNSDQYIMASCYDRHSSWFTTHTPTCTHIDHWFFMLEIL